jgi:hypothetical protein
MHQAAKTYGKVAKEIAKPRELEADLLLKAAARLQAIRDAWESKSPDLRFLAKTTVSFPRRRESRWNFKRCAQRKQRFPLSRE